jgi:hypothetical protein
VAVEGYNLSRFLEDYLPLFKTFFFTFIMIYNLYKNLLYFIRSAGKYAVLIKNFILKIKFLNKIFNKSIIKIIIIFIIIFL